MTAVVVAVSAAGVAIAWAGVTPVAKLAVARSDGAFGLANQAPTVADHKGNSEFGTSVALSSDGDAALIGGPYDGAVNTGAAWIFTRSGSAWTQAGPKLLSFGGENSEFGASVALSSDGSTALIGAPGLAPGGAYVFTRAGSAWTPNGPELVPNEAGLPFGVGDGSGLSVALSSDGDTALIAGGGAAWVFTRSGSSWAQQNLGVWGDQTGCTTGIGITQLYVALSGDGDTALVADSAANCGAGAVYVFTLSGSTWVQQSVPLTAGASMQGNFGAGVALSSGGNTAIVSNDREVWVFTQSGGAWTQQGPPLAGTGEPVTSGYGDVSIALSGDGNTVLLASGDLGVAKTDSGGPGEAWVFTRSGSTWTQQGPEITVQQTPYTWPWPSFGASSALSGDGSTALIGAPDATQFAGAVWGFTRSATSWSQGPEMMPNDAEQFACGAATIKVKHWTYVNSNFKISYDGSVAHTAFGLVQEPRVEVLTSPRIHGFTVSIAASLVGFKRSWVFHNYLPCLQVEAPPVYQGYGHVVAGFSMGKYAYRSVPNAITVTVSTGGHVVFHRAFASVAA